MSSISLLKHHITSAIYFSTCLIFRFHFLLSMLEGPTFKTCPGILLRASPTMGAVGRPYWNPQLVGWHLFTAGWNIPNLNKNCHLQSGSVFQPAIVFRGCMFSLCSFWVIGTPRGPSLRINRWKQFGPGQLWVALLCRRETNSDACGWFFLGGEATLFQQLPG